MPRADQVPPIAERLSKFLPPSLGTLFGQPDEEAVQVHSPPAGFIPGAHAAPELCTLLDRYAPDVIPKTALTEVKVDGIRALHIAGRIYTREGSTFEAAEHCLPLLHNLERWYGKPMFFDGEYVEDGGIEATLAAFRSRKGNGVLWLFDAVPFDEWQSGKPSRETLFQRKTLLRRALAAVTRNQPSNVGYLENSGPMNASAIEARARSLWASGFEGLVIKAADSFYCRKRTCDWLKLKLRTVTPMVIVDVVGCSHKVEVVKGNERKTVEQMRAKALLVRLPSLAADGRPQRPVKLPVRGGLAETLWRRRGDLVGTTCEVEHSGFTGAGNPREAELKKVTI